MVWGSAKWLAASFALVVTHQSNGCKSPVTRVASHLAIRPRPSKGLGGKHRIWKAGLLFP